MDKKEKDIWIIDTKKGTTAELKDTKYKAEALQEWLKGRKDMSGGIAVQDGPNGWKIQNGSTYLYNQSFTGWKNLKDLF